MTLTPRERDILAVALSLNSVFMILVLPGVVPIYYDHDLRGLVFTTLAWGLPLGAIGVWWNHRVAAWIERKESTSRGPSRRR